MKRITILGGGPGGYTAAFAAAKAGAAVTLVEPAGMGGTCLNSGCIPTKTLKASAEALETAHRLAEFGITGVGEAVADMAKIVARKEKVRQVLCGGLEKTCAMLKVTLVRGKGRLAGGTNVAVALNEGGETLVEGDAVILATGSRALDLPGLAVDHAHILSSDDALNLTEVPKRLLIVGGGVIGCELAFIFQAFGSKVRIVEGQTRLLPLPAVDEEISKLLLRETKKRGIAAELGATVAGVEKRPDGSVLVNLGPSPFVAPELAWKGDGPTEADAVMVTVGRAPNSGDLGLKEAGVETDARGWISVNDRMETSAQNIYAVGDVLGPAKIMLAHVAAVEGLCAVANCLGRDERMDYRVVPSGIFTSPEIGTVGMSEAEAKAKNIPVKTAVFQMRELGKAQAMGEPAGLFKLIAEEGSGKLLGAHIAGAHASDLVAEAALALQMGATAADVANTIHSHPTLAEGMYEAALSLAGGH